LTNAGGVIADMFPARERGLAMSIFAAAPFMGPVLGFVSRIPVVSETRDVGLKRRLSIR
jgi:MFS family permease